MLIDTLNPRNYPDFPEGEADIPRAYDALRDAVSTDVQTVAGVSASGLWGAVAVVPIASGTQLGANAAGKLHLCTGDTYTLDLPSAASCADKTLMFQMADLTGFVTLSSADFINKQAARLMHGGESAVLWSDGATWRKIGGRSIPLQAYSETQDETNIPSNAYTFIPTKSAISQTVAGLIDTALGVVNIKRPGTYLVDAFVAAQIAGSEIGGIQAYAYFSVNNTSGDLPFRPSAVSVVPTAVATANTFMHVGVSAPRIFNAGDYIALSAFQTTGATMTTRPFPVVKSHLNLIEIPNW